MSLNKSVIGSPNITLRSDVTNSGAPFIRIVSTTNTSSYAMGITAGSSLLRISYNAGTTAVPGTTDVVTISSAGDVTVTNNISAISVASTGTINSVTDGNIVIDASLDQFATWIASFAANRTLQIGNLTNGRWVKVYMRNTNASSRIHTIQASTTLAGYGNVNLAASGGVSQTSITLSATTGTAVVFVGNVNGTFIGYFG
jgi:hypothetical protein